MSTTSSARWASKRLSKDVLINICRKRRASTISKTHWLLTKTRTSFRFLLHLRWWGKHCPAKFQCLTWSLLRLSQLLAKLLQRHAAPLDLPQAATATQMRKRLLLITSLKAPSNLSVNVNPSSIKRHQPLTSTHSLLRREMSSRRTHGSVRSRPNCVGSGCKAFNARTKSRNKDAVLPMDRKNFRRKRPWADSTLHRSVRISWRTQANAHTVPDASSSIQRKTWESDNPTLIWWWTTNDIRRWDFSRRSREPMYST